MRGIFFANGPSFKSGFVNPWIKLVDEYQVLKARDIFCSSKASIPLVMIAFSADFPEVTGNRRRRPRRKL